MRRASGCFLILGFVAGLLAAPPVYARPASEVFIVRAELPVPSHKATTRVAYDRRALYGHLRYAISAVRPYGPAGITIYARSSNDELKAIISWAEPRCVTASIVETGRVPGGSVEIVVYPTFGSARRTQPIEWVPEYNENDMDPDNGAYIRSATAYMLDNRRDLVRGRGTRLSDGERAAQIVSRYRAYRPSSGNGSSVEQPQVGDNGSQSAGAIKRN